MKNSSKRPPPSSSKPSSSSKNSSRRSRWESEHAKTKNPSPSKSNNPKKDPHPQKDPPSSSFAAPPHAASPHAPPPHAASPHALPPHAPPPHIVPPGGASPFTAVPPPLIYGFQNLERRTIVLADGSARTYLALPPDYPLEPFGHQRLGFDRLNASPDRFGPGAGMHRDFGPRPGSHREFRIDGHAGEMVGPSGMKRKFGEEDEYAWHRQHVSQYGSNPGFNNVGLERSPMRRKTDNEAGVVDLESQLLKRAFLNFAKVINENANHKVYLEDVKKGVEVNCVICRASFPDVHGLIMHLYTTQKPDQRVDHLGLHKALCILMGWNYAKAPDNLKAYQSLSSDEASANREDLIVWPPTVVLHNTSSGKKKDGQIDGMGNREMDSKLKDLGFGGGKARSMYGKEGHTGITLVKFASTHAGLKEAENLAGYLEKGNHGRKGWAKAKQIGINEEKNPALVKDEERVLYGYLATAFDLDILDTDLKKKAVIKSRKELDL